MSSNDDDNNNRNRPESNPFIVFRRFADEQASALFDAIHSSVNSRREHYRKEQEPFPRTPQSIPEQQEKNDEQMKEGSTPSQDSVDSKLQEAFGSALSEDFGRARDVFKDLKPTMDKEFAKMLRSLEPGDLERVKRMARFVGGPTADVEIERIMEQGVDEERKDVTQRDGGGRGSGWGSGVWWVPRGHDATVRDEEAEKRRMCRWNRRRHNIEESKTEQDEQQSAWSNMKNTMDKDEKKEGNGDPKVYEWHWSWSYPPRSSDSFQEMTRSKEIEGPSSADSVRRRDPIPRPSNIFDDFDKAFEDAFGVFKSLGSTSPWSKHDNHAILHSSEYSPLVLQHDRDLEDSGVDWRDAYEDLVRAERNLPLLPSRELGKASQLPFHHWTGRFLRPEYQNLPQTGYPKPVPWLDEEASAEAAEGSEPSYEYSHDHEDQHDDPPTPKPNTGEFPPPSPSETQDAPLPETELEIYERLLGPFPSTQSSTPTTEPAFSQPETATQSNTTSILSTLTTTERTVAPDGTVTTKMVLKKRFADGREESSETVHTQRGQGQADDGKGAWDAMWGAQFGSTSASKKSEEKKGGDESEKKKSGWFWSG